MKLFKLGLFFIVLAIFPLGRAEEWVPKPRPDGITGTTCDSRDFLEWAVAADKVRPKRRISAENFARMAKEPGTIVLDARGREHYEALHVKGSVNLPYTSFAEETLRKLIPKRDTRILIYCRNNLLHANDYDPPKIPQAGLNIPTFVTLFCYGYSNVWELDPAVDPNGSPIEFERAKPASSADQPAQSRASIKLADVLNNKVAPDGALGLPLGSAIKLTGKVGISNSPVVGELKLSVARVNGRAATEPVEIILQGWDNLDLESCLGKEVSVEGYERLEEIGYSAVHWELVKKRQDLDRAQGRKFDPAMTSVQQAYRTYFLVITASSTAP